MGRQYRKDYRKIRMMDTAIKILLVEDEELIGTMVKLNLTQEGFEVVWYREGKPALLSARHELFDLILLDIMLPDANGIDLARSLRNQGVGAPILMLTARGDVSSKVESLEAGADDYLIKPFDIRELIARVRALIRRSQGERQPPSSALLAIGQNRINLETREVVTSDGNIILSEKETALVSLFIRNAGKTLSRADILEEVWGMDVNPTERTVDNFILHLRRLFESNPSRPRHFITVRNVGYRFEP